MIDKRIGKRIKERRESLGLTQEEFALRLGLTTNYISTIERGASFPRCEKLIAILNGLEASADAVFCDVLDYTPAYHSNLVLRKMRGLSPRSQKKILNIMEVLIEQEKEDNR